MKAPDFVPVIQTFHQTPDGLLLIGATEPNGGHSKAPRSVKLAQDMKVLLKSRRFPKHVLLFWFVFSFILGKMWGSIIYSLISSASVPTCAEFHGSAVSQRQVCDCGPRRRPPRGENPSGQSVRNFA